MNHCTTGTWYPPFLGTGGFLADGQLFTNPPFTEMTDSNFSPLPDRDRQHGVVAAVGEISQAMKAIMRSSPNWPRMGCGGRESLEMIAHKIARILAGANPCDREHWEDVAGYATAFLRSGEEMIDE